MAMTRYESLPKKDRDEVLRIKSLHDSDASSMHDYTRMHIGYLKNWLAKTGERTPSSLLASFLHRLMSHACLAGIVRRLLENDVQAQMVGFNTAARLGFLVRVAGGRAYSGGYDCAHVWDLLLALTSDDRETVNAFVQCFAAPFKVGHPGTVLFANALYAALERDETTLEQMTPMLTTRNDSQFFRAMLDALIAIGARNSDGLSEALLKMCKGNKRQDQLNFSLQKLVCRQAHAFFNLGNRILSDEGVDVPMTPDHRAWDAEFHEFVHSRENESPRFFDFSNANPALARWVAELPNQIAIDELLAHEY